MKDATRQLPESNDFKHTGIQEAGFHAIYLDAFSPDTNPECWGPVFIQQLAHQLTIGGRLSTYSAKGDVRRALLAAGLAVSKRQGPPGKREMLVALRDK